MIQPVIVATIILHSELSINPQGPVISLLDEFMFHGNVLSIMTKKNKTEICFFYYKRTLFFSDKSKIKNYNDITEGLSYKNAQYTIT